MSRNAHRFLILLALLTPALASAQTAKRQRADRLVDQLAYREAIPLYLDLAGEDDDPALALRLAECYRMVQDVDRAEAWYAKVAHLDTLDPVYRLRYAQTLMASEKYALARSWLDRYAAERPDDPRGAWLASACRDIDGLVAQSFPAEVEPVSFNGPRADFGPAWLPDGRLLFASDRDTIRGVRRSDPWYGGGFLGLYVVDPDAESPRPRALRGDVNGPWHDGPAVAAGADRIYLTRSAEQTDATGRGPIRRLTIVKARETRPGKWALTDETALPFPGEGWSAGHPALSADGRTMVFAADRPGGYGGTDLYRSTLLADGSAWSEPVNLGAAINTPGQEAFPFLHADGTLYFASDGLPGFGGLDVFSAAPEGEGFAAPRNLGKPVNSSRDDHGLILDEERAEGYLVSNRFGGRGGDDLYRVRNVGVRLEGVVTSAYDGKPVPGASVRLRRAPGEPVDAATTPRDGTYAFRVGAKRRYELVVQAPGYLQRVVPAPIGALAHPASVRLDVALEDTLQIRLVVQVLDQDSRSPLPGARVLVYDKCTGENREWPTDSAGLLRVRLEPNCTFYLAGRKRGYIDANEVVSTVGMAESAELGAILALPEIKEDLVIELKNIYYDYGRYYIREDAVEDLDNLAALMAEYPSLKIEISSHTDSRGSDEFNKRLSQQRAETCVDYLVTKGVDRERLVARGYGEYVPKNDCSNGVDCTEEEHQVNRRTEFKVLSFDKVLYSDDVASPAVNLYKKAFGEDQVIRSREDMIALGLIDAPATVILQRDADGENLEDPVPSSSPLLFRQREASRAAARAMGWDLDALPLDVALAPVTLSPDPPAERPSPSAEGQGPTPAPKPAPRPAPRPLPDPPAAVSTEPLPEGDDRSWWTDGVSYAVQIAYGTDRTEAYAEYGDLGSVYSETKANGTSVVLIGRFRKFSEANAIQQTVRDRGLRDAFVVSYVDGERLE